MNGNSFELTGKISFIDMKYAKTGTAILTALMSKKGREENEYDSFAITFFGKTAEEFGNRVAKGDYVNVKGKLDIDKYEKDGKEIKKVTLIGFEYVKVEYDKKQGCYIEIKEELPW